MIWLGLRTNGEAFSGDREPILSGVPAVDDFVGELVGVVSLWPAWEFCLRNGDWRTLPVSDPAGDSVDARNVDYEGGQQMVAVFRVGKACTHHVDGCLSLCGSQYALLRTVQYQRLYYRGSA